MLRSVIFCASRPKGEGLIIRSLEISHDTCYGKRLTDASACRTLELSSGTLRTDVEDGANIQGTAGPLYSDVRFSVANRFEKSTVFFHIFIVIFQQILVSFFVHYFIFTHGSVNLQGTAHCISLFLPALDRGQKNSLPQSMILEGCMSLKYNWLLNKLCFNNNEGIRWRSCLLASLFRSLKLRLYYH